MKEIGYFFKQGVKIFVISLFEYFIIVSFKMRLFCELFFSFYLSLGFRLFFRWFYIFSICCWLVFRLVFFFLGLFVCAFFQSQLGFGQWWVGRKEICCLQGRVQNLFVFVIRFQQVLWLFLEMVVFFLSLGEVLSICQRRIVFFFVFFGGVYLCGMVGEGKKGVDAYIWGFGVVFVIFLFEGKVVVLFFVVV